MKTKRYITLFFLLIYLSIGAFGCSDNEDNSTERDIYFVYNVLPSEINCAEICPKGEYITMGGEQFAGSIILSSIDYNEYEAKVSYELPENISYISFFIGSTNDKKVYFSNSDVVSVVVDNVSVIEKTVYNHSLPSYHTINVKGAKTLTFQAQNKSVITAIGEIKAWENEAPSQNTSEENSTQNKISKLMYDIKPYYCTTDEYTAFFAYSENGDTLSLDGKEYTDAFLIKFHKLQNWSNQTNVYFALKGKYKYLSFNAGIEFLTPTDLLSPTPLAKLSILKDDKVIFEYTFSSLGINNFRIPIDQCEKLCFVWESVPNIETLNCVVTSAYVEKN